MNLKAKLKLMDLSDLRFVCRELGISCPKTKKSIIKKLLEPLNKNYKMEIEMEPWERIVERKEKRKKKKADLFRLRKIGPLYIQRMRKKTNISNTMRKNLLEHLEAVQKIRNQTQIYDFNWKRFYKAFTTYYPRLNTKSKNKIIKKLNEAILDNEIYILTHDNKNIYNQKNKALETLVETIKKDDK